jgi:FAD/FMN-containing dehydrogenase
MTTTDLPKLDATAVAELAASFGGAIVRPTDVDYDERRAIWNGSINKSPALIARCAGVADVIDAVRFARNGGSPVAVRGGGHSFPGHSVCDDGLVIDLGPMKGIRVDPDARTARVQGGVQLGELDRETQAFGHAVPAGIVTHTGVAGLTLGGGIGWLHRKFGLTIDNLLSVDVVTADGSFVKANENENADLFWGVRGGGGNFGIVTEFEFRLSELGTEVLAGPILWPIEKAADVLRFYRDWIAGCPDELMTIVTARQAPDLPFIPRDLVGKLVVGVVCCYAGSIEDGEKVVAPLRAFDAPVLDACIPKPFVAHQASMDASFEPGWWYYFRACDVDELNDEVIDITADYIGRIDSPITSIALWQMGGAVRRVGEDDTAFTSRKAGHTFNINGNTYGREGFDEQRQWVREFWSALEPHHMGVYVNFLADEGEERVREAYGPARYDRLKALKRKYDPENFFRLNQNITPG